MRHSGLYCTNGLKCQREECTEQFQLCRHDSAYMQKKVDLYEENNRLRAEVASLKEQNALLTVQVQKVYAALELLHDHARLYLGAYHEGQNVFDSSMDALTTLAALPQPVKSEDARECRWSPMDEMNMPGTYEGTCGVAWSFTEGGIKENEANYCPRCGGKVVDVAAITVRNPA